MARTDRTKPTTGGIRRAIQAKRQTQKALLQNIRRGSAVFAKTKPGEKNFKRGVKKLKKLGAEFDKMMKFEDTMPSRNIGKVKHGGKKNPFGSLTK